MTEIRATDFSFARISAAELVQNNVFHVSRYLAYLPNGKVITKPEYDADIAAGITVYFNWETTATRPEEGPGAGYADGLEARRQLDALGAPRPTVVIISLDTDPRSGVNWNAVHDYLQAFSEALGCKVGFYSGAFGIDMVWQWSFIDQDYLWQTAAWSAGVLSPHAALYQRVGHTWRLPGVADDQYDEDVVIHSGLVPATPPPPSTLEDMLLTPKHAVADATFAAGRIPHIRFDKDNRRFLSYGYDFKPTAGYTITYGFGLVIATLNVVTNGDLDFGESADGHVAFIGAGGDFGTFALQYKEVAADAPAPALDYAQLAEEVVSHLAATTTVTAH